MHNELYLNRLRGDDVLCLDLDHFLLVDSGGEERLETGIPERAGIVEDDSDSKRVFVDSLWKCQ